MQTTKRRPFWRGLVWPLALAFLLGMAGCRSDGGGESGSPSPTTGTAAATGTAESQGTEEAAATTATGPHDETVTATKPHGGSKAATRKVTTAHKAATTKAKPVDQKLPDTVKAWTDHALTDILAATDMPSGAAASGQIHLLRNESESIQLAVRPGAAPLTDVQVTAEPIGGGDLQVTVSRIAAVKFSKASALIGDYRRAAAGTALPEYYQKSSRVERIAKGETVSFCVEATTTAKTKAGTYRTNLVITSNEGTRKLPLTVRVYSAALPEPKDAAFDYVCWSVTAGWNGDGADKLNDTFFDAAGYNAQFWTLMKNYATVMKKQRQNVINVPIRELLGSGVTIDGSGGYRFDFSHFDRYVETFLQYGSIKYLAGEHLLDKDWYIAPNDPSWPTNSTDAWVYVHKNGKVQYEWAFTDSDKAQRHLEQLLKALYAHLKDKGWDKIWIQNVCDEVAGLKSKQQVAQTYDLVHRLMPGIETTDAGNQLNSRYGDKLDIPVPRLDDYAASQTGYQQLRQATATALWTYTCDGPQGNAMSRLNDFPLISTRALGWYTWQNQIDGYLHWAWNRWQALLVSGGDPFADMSCAGGPADGFLVYPDVENLSVLEGTRSTAMRDAIEDHELLRLAAAKRPAEVKQLTDSLIRTYQDFERNPQAYLDARLKLLEIVG